MFFVFPDFKIFALLCQLFWFTKFPYYRHETLSDYIVLVSIHFVLKHNNRINMMLLITEAISFTSFFYWY